MSFFLIAVVISVDIYRSNGEYSSHSAVWQVHRTLQSGESPSKRLKMVDCVAAFENSSVDDDFRTPKIHRAALWQRNSGVDSVDTRRGSIEEVDGRRCKRRIGRDELEVCFNCGLPTSLFWLTSLLRLIFVRAFVREFMRKSIVIEAMGLFVSKGHLNHLCLFSSERESLRPCAYSDQHKL